MELSMPDEGSQIRIKLKTQDELVAKSVEEQFPYRCRGYMAAAI